jgi:hypothetical protein
MWEPQRLTTLWASTVCYRDSFSYINNKIKLRRVRWEGHVGRVEEEEEEEKKKKKNEYKILLGIMKERETAKN